MKIIDVIVMISQPDDNGNILVVNASASEEVGTPTLQDPIGIQLGLSLNAGFEIASTKPIGDGMVQYTLLRRRHVCDPCPCDYDKDKRPWK